MAALDADQYFTYEARLNSFQKTTKKRGLANGGRSAKALNWPHKQISPANLARVGFFFRPTSESVDNTVCFLCEKGLDGWETGDDPLSEHLKHSPQCGWAVVAAIEAEIGDYHKEDPNSPDMMEARKATFGGKWPHDAKKGWKCKTKQLVEAGWKYTPTVDSDDMATCAYCQLALDGWEPNDRPFDEHFSRSPACPFFSLLEQYKGSTSKNTTRAKSSRARRASSQSVASETTAMTDQTTGPEDNVLPTGNGTKRTRAKRSTVTKGIKKRAKKEETSDMLEESQQTGYETSQSQGLFQSKAKRGRKRGSEVVDESTVNTTNEPAPKKRNRTPISTAENSSLTDSTEATDAAAPKAGRSKKMQSSALNLAHRTPEPQASPSSPSVASPRAPPGNFPDDDEIERQLDEDLARQLDETDIAQDSDSERSRAKIKVLPDNPEELTAPAQKISASYAMFDPNAPDPDEKIIDDELKMLQAEMEVDEPEPSRHGSQKDPSPGTRRVSNKSAAYSEEDVNSAEVDMQSEDQAQDEDDDMTVGSTETVLKKAYRKKTRKGRPSTASMVSTTSQEDEIDELRLDPPTKRGRGRPSKASIASQSSAKGEEDTQSSEAQPKRGRGRPSKSSLTSQDRDDIVVSADKAKEDEPSKSGRGRPCKKSLEKRAEVAAEEAEVEEPQPIERIESNGAKSPQAAQDEPLPRSASPSLQAPSTPAKTISPAPSAKQPNLSPSQTPQSSDAENQPPLSRSAATASKRAALAAVTATPMRVSPSKRNVLAGLQSTTPWTAANVEAIFGTPHAAGRSTESNHNNNSVEHFLRRGRELSTPEKQMTVEEWIYFNADEAEKKLKHECETLVSRFENEGTRAINVLEGLEVEL